MTQADPPGQQSRYDSYESVYRSCLNADARPVIRAASADQLRLVLRRITGHLCHQLRRDLTESLPPGSAPATAWGVCQASSATRSGFQLYHQVSQAIAVGCLDALGFDPHAAAASDAYLEDGVEPVLTAATRRRMRGLLLGLIGHIQAAMDDADDSADMTAGIDLPENAWEAGTGVTTAIQLYRHAALVQTGWVLSHLWDALSASGAPILFPCTPGPSSAGFPAQQSPN